MLRLNSVKFAPLGLVLACSFGPLAGCAASDDGTPTVGSAGKSGAAGASSSGGSGGASGGSADAGSSSTTFPSAGTGSNPFPSGGTGSGTSGSSNGGSSNGGAGMSKCTSRMKVTTSKIQDFENGPGDDQSVGMDVYMDDTMGGTISPADTASVATGVVTGGANGTSKAFELTGQSFPDTSWGAGFDIWVLCSDASAAKGIKLWMKNDAPVTMSVDIDSNNYQMGRGLCTGGQAGCKQSSTTIPAHATWTEVSVTWAQLTGGKPKAFDPTQIISVTFVVKASPSFDVSIDEVQWLGLDGAGGSGSGGAGGTGGAGH